MSVSVPGFYRKVIVKHFTNTTVPEGQPEEPTTGITKQSHNGSHLQVILRCLGANLKVAIIRPAHDTCLAILDRWVSVGVGDVAG